MTRKIFPKEFVWRRLHSLTGLFLVLFLMMHLFTNGQSALLIGDDGRGFIHAVNNIHEMPFLIILEIVGLGAPIALHALWGVHYIFTGKPNSFKTDGKSPSLPEYGGNRAYTWQRITSWILLVGVIAHIGHMRIANYPDSEQVGSEHYYIQTVSNDPGLESVGERLGVEIENQGEESLVIAKDFGTATLFLVRDIFKSPWMMVVYTIFVLAACFHAFNGLWTFCISWGVTLSNRSQKMMRKITLGLMAAIAFMGLACIWLTYWVNLRY